MTELKKNNTMASNKKIKNPHALGILFVIIDSLGFSLMALNVRLAGNLPVMQKAF